MYLTLKSLAINILAMLEKYCLEGNYRNLNGTESIVYVLGLFNGNKQ